MARVTNDDLNDERTGRMDSERDLVRGVADEGDDFEEAEDLDEEDIDDEEDSTF